MHKIPIEKTHYEKIDARALTCLQAPLLENEELTNEVFQARAQVRSHLLAATIQSLRLAYRLLAETEEHIDMLPAEFPGTPFRDPPGAQMVRLQNIVRATVTRNHKYAEELSSLLMYAYLELIEEFDLKAFILNHGSIRKCIEAAKMAGF